jgi:hypothetical protein
MKSSGFILLLVIVNICWSSAQVTTNPEGGIFFHGIVRDASTFSPLPNSQIIINKALNSVSDEEGQFSFWGNKKDTVIISQLGYKPAVINISDTLSGKEFLAGVYLRSDTIHIGEVIILPRLTSLKYEILNTPVTTSPEMENAKYNVALSAYQGRITQGSLGDPQANYNIIHQQQKIEAYERGGIPSNRIVGLNPFMILPAAYLLLNGLPPKPEPIKVPLTQQEIDQIHERYLESIENKVSPSK